MPLTTAGVTEMVKAILGEAVTAFNNANSYLGVGDSSTAFAVGQTDLQAASNKVRQAMEATYPSRSGLVVTLRSLFATGVANFAWEEWGWFNGSSGATMLTRKVESLGTKTSASSWQLTATVTFSA